MSAGKHVCKTTTNPVNSSDIIVTLSFCGTGINESGLWITPHEWRGKSASAASLSPSCRFPVILTASATQARLVLKTLTDRLGEMGRKTDMWMNAAACRPACVCFSSPVIFLIWGFFEEPCVVFSWVLCLCIILTLSAPVTGQHLCSLLKETSTKPCFQASEVHCHLEWLGNKTHTVINILIKEHMEETQDISPHLAWGAWQECDVSADLSKLTMRGRFWCAAEAAGNSQWCHFN